MAPLRRTILLRVTLLVAGTALAVGLGFIGFGLLPMVERIAQSQFNVAAARIEASLDSMFAPANDLLDMSRGWINGEAPSLDDPSAFNRIFMPVIKSLPQVTSVVAGTTTGQGWLLLQQAGGSWRNRMTDVPRNGRKHLFFEHLPNGQVTSEWRDVDYDPRRRPWYLAAMNGTAGTLTHWTAPYLFFTTGDVGVTASTRIRLKDGRDFVLGFDLMLRDLSKATMQSAVGKQGMVLVLTDDNRVLALPVAPSLAPPDWLKKVLRPVDELGLAPVSDALAAWLATQRASGSVLAYRSGGEPWLASMRPYLLGEQKLWVMTLAPAADFAPAWGTLSTVLATLLALVLLLGFL
ncbi:MAG: cache domain-containing protein, partial [Burkholderiales bacterium]|nr:cache domain-containing protein [Burkholderiales bacterium]